MAGRRGHDDGIRERIDEGARAPLPSRCVALAWTHRAGAPGPSVECTHRGRGHRAHRPRRYPVQVPSDPAPRYGVRVQVVLRHLVDSRREQKRVEPGLAPDLARQEIREGIEVAKQVGYEEGIWPRPARLCLELSAPIVSAFGHAHGLPILVGAHRSREWEIPASCDVSGTLVPGGVKTKRYSTSRSCAARRPGSLRHRRPEGYPPAL